MKPVYHFAIHYVGLVPLVIVTEKRCNACLQFKPLDEYHADKAQKDGLKPICMECRKDPTVRTYTHQEYAEGVKVCTKCLQEKSREEDFNKGDGLDGYNPWCKDCQSEYNHQKRQENIEHYQEYDRIRARTPERKAQYRKRYREAYAFNPRYIARKRIYGSAWSKANRLRKRESLLRYIAHKKKAVAGKVSYQHILERDGRWCYICEQPILPHQKLVFDHVIPLRPRPGEPQGTHTEDNIRPAHEACNVRKSNIPFECLTDWHKRGPDRAV